MVLPPAFIENTEHVNAIIEVPRGSRNKYVYDPELQLLKLKKVLPAGLAMPFDFGFIPGTMAEDGDPLDIMVLMEEPATPGCLVESRVIGIIEVEQTQPDGKLVRNDRVVAVALQSHWYARINSINELDDSYLNEVLEFFRLSHQHDQKQITAINVADAATAFRTIHKSLVP